LVDRDLHVPLAGSRLAIGRSDPCRSMDCLCENAAASIRRTLDDQLFKEAFASHTMMASNPAVPELLKQLYEKSDKGVTV
jgi:hypothetical protein